MHWRKRWLYGFSPTCFLIMCLLRLLDCYNVEYVLFDILRKYTIYSLESTRSFTFVHMLICQLCYKQLCWLHEKSTRAIIYYAICEIFYINKITKFCMAGGCIVTNNVFFNSCPLFSTPVLTSQF